MKRLLLRFTLTVALLAGVFGGTPAYATAATPSQVIGPSEFDRTGFLVGIMVERS